MQEQDIIKGRDDALGHYKRKGFLQEDIIEGRDDAGGHYKRKG